MESSPLEQIVTQAVVWIRENKERFWAISGGLLLSFLFIGLLIHKRAMETDLAWSELGIIQSDLAQGKNTEARKAIEGWDSRHQNSNAAAYASFLKADLAYRTTDYGRASQIYGDIAQTGQPDVVRPLALSAQISSEEMAGHFSNAQSLAQTFIDKYPDHYLAAPMYMTQARLSELSGNTAAAVAVYDRFTLLFPQSPWTTLAKTRSQTLSKK